MNTYCCFAPVDDSTFNSSTGVLSSPLLYNSVFPSVSDSTNLVRAIPASDSIYMYQNYSHLRLVGASMRC